MKRLINNPSFKPHVFKRVHQKETLLSKWIWNKSTLVTIWCSTTETCHGISTRSLPERVLGKGKSRPVDSHSGTFLGFKNYSVTKSIGTRTVLTQSWRVGHRTLTFRYPYWPSHHPIRKSSFLHRLPSGRQNYQLVRGLIWQGSRVTSLNEKGILNVLFLRTLSNYS